MIYTKKNPALFIIGIIMLAIWYLASTGAMASLIKYLGMEKHAWEYSSLSLYFGILSLVIGAWQLFGSHKEGNWDYFSSSVAGAMFILLIVLNLLLQV